MDPNSINPHEVELREQDRLLPIANVARLMKNTLPASAKVSKDAKECMQECVSEFISFVTSEGSDRCLREKRKTINGEDILYSMHDLGFENYAEVLKIYLAKYREQQAIRQENGESKLTKKQLKAQAMATVDSSSAGDTMGHKESISDDENDNHDGVDHDHNVMNSHTPGNSSIGSSESFFDQYGDEIDDKGKLDHRNDKRLSTHKEEYEYNDFINEENDDENNNIDDLAKKLTNDEPDIDTLTAGIANGTNGNSYF